jgi:hypothetical protein
MTLSYCSAPQYLRSQAYLRRFWACSGVIISLIIVYSRFYAKTDRLSLARHLERTGYAIWSRLIFIAFYSSDNISFISVT